MSDLRDQAVKAAAQSLADSLGGRTRTGYPTKFAVDMVAAAEPFLRAQVIAEVVEMLFRRAEENRASETTYEMAVKDAGAYLLWKLDQDA